MPEQGQEETVRIVALDRSFHVNCYVCEVRLKPEPVWYCCGVVALSWLERVSTRNVDSCCPLRGRAEAVTHWTATSCARAAAPGASRTCRPKSPPTADFKTPFVTTLCYSTSSSWLADIGEGAKSVTDQVPVNQQPRVISFRIRNFSFLLLLLHPRLRIFPPDLQAAWAPPPPVSQEVRRF